MLGIQKGPNSSLQLMLVALWSCSDLRKECCTGGKPTAVLSVKTKEHEESVNRPLAVKSINCKRNIKINKVYK